MGHLTFVFDGDGPFEPRCCFVRHFSCCTRRFDFSESASISRPPWNAGSMLSVERPQRTSSSFAPRAKQRSSRSNGATVRQEARVPMAGHR